MPTASYVKMQPAVENMVEGANLGTDSWAIKLATAVTASTGAMTEVANGNGYTTGGNTLVSVTPVASGTTAVCDFADTTWSAATFTTSGALIYNDTAAGDPACAVLSFGGDQQVSSGDFQIQFPAAAASTAIIRIA